MVSIIRTEVEGMAPESVQRFSEKWMRREAGDAQVVVIRQDKSAPRTHASLYVNILCALNQCAHAKVFITEHDVLYPAGYFAADKVPEHGISYAKSGFYLLREGYAWRNGTPMSTLCGHIDALRACLSVKLADCLNGKRIVWTEPGRGDSVDYSVRHEPFLDIRHGQNWTGSRGGGLRHTVWPWGHYAELWNAIEKEEQ